MEDKKDLEEEIKKEENEVNTSESNESMEKNKAKEDIDKNVEALEEVESLEDNNKDIEALNEEKNSDVEEKKEDFTPEQDNNNITETKQKEKINIIEKIKTGIQTYIYKLKTDKKTRIYTGVALGALILLIIIIFSLFKTGVIGENSFEVTDVYQSSKGDYISSNETFIIYATGGTLEDVRKHIYIEPAINYQIEKSGLNRYKLTTSDIPSDTVVNISFIDNLVVEDKWAFQSSKDLKVNSVYPADGSSGVSIGSSIEIVFSYYGISNIDDYVEISPAVEGSFEHNGRTWIFKPTTPLQPNTVYTVTIKEGLKCGDQELKETTQTTFSTYDSPSNNNGNQSQKLNYDSITIDNILTFRPVDVPMFRSGSVSRIEILKLKSSDDFKNLLENKEYASDSMGDIAFHHIEEEGNSSTVNQLYTFENILDKGYYVARGYLDNGELYFTMPIQVNELSAYLLNTQCDLLVWVGSDNSLLKDIPITFEGKTVKTDKDGLATFKDYNTLEGKIKYITIGKDNPIFVGVNTKDNEAYANGYVYTDRPLYKNDDEIKIWGYVPVKFYNEWKDFSLDNFVLTFNDENIPIKLQEDGTFITTFNLNNYKDGNYVIKLLYKDNSHVIAYRSVEVLQYEKENYRFKIKRDKDYVVAGEDYKFNVEVEHISGVMVPNKEIRAVIDEVEYPATTDENGVASFSIPTSQGTSLYSNNHYVSVNVKSSLTEYSQKGIRFSYQVIDRYISVDVQSQKNNKVQLKMYSLKDPGEKKTIKEWLEDKEPYSGNVSIELIESKSTRSLTGNKYNEFTKENTPIYTWSSAAEKNVLTKTVEVKDGKLTYAPNYNFQQSTEDTRYTYNIIITATDYKGNQYVTTMYNISYKDSDSLNSSGYIYYEYGIVNSNNYNVYDYYFDSIIDKQTVDNTIKRELNEYTGALAQEGNPILIVKYKNHILENKVYTYKSDLSIKFEDNNRPNTETTAAYFKDGVFHRIPVDRLTEKAENEKLDIEITPNSKKYKPGDDVSVQIKVGKNGKGKKSKIIVSVVDEGVFANTGDNTNILSQIYGIRDFYQYTYSTYRNYNLYYNGGGAGSTSGSARSDFGDTIYFEVLETDKNGNAKVDFKLNDSITSFRITVHAVTDNVEVGANYTNIESSLPVSISFVEPRGLKVSDDVVLNASSLGYANESVHYEFKIEELNKTETKDALIGQTVFASFGQLVAGDYTVTITATSGDSSDKVQYPIHVSNIQTELFVKNTFSIKESKKIKPTKNPIILELYRDSFKDYERYLNIISETKEERLDTKISYEKAMNYENKYLEEKNVAELGDVNLFKGEDGWKYLPAEEVSYPLTAIVSYYNSDLRFDKSIYYQMTQSENAAIRLHGYVVLASMKEPVLDDVRYLFNNYDSYTDEEKEELSLAALFLGDYNTVRRENSGNQGLSTYLSTFVNKNVAASKIDNLYKNDTSNRYLYFSIISFFENNNVELETKEEVTVSYGKKKEKIELSSLGKKKLVIYQNDLKELKIKSKYKDISYSYYYEGSLDEIDESLKSQVIQTKLSNDNPSVGDMVTLDVDITQVPRDTVLKIYLPNGLRLSSGDIGQGSYIRSNKIDYLTIYIGNNSTNQLQIPLYASSIGKYTIEPIVIKSTDGKYYLSNSINVDIK